MTGGTGIEVHHRGITTHLPVGREGRGIDVTGGIGTDLLLSTSIVTGNARGIEIETEIETVVTGSEKEREATGREKERGTAVIGTERGREIDTQALPAGLITPPFEEALFLDVNPL